MSALEEIRSRFQNDHLPRMPRALSLILPSPVKRFVPWF